MLRKNIKYQKGFMAWTYCVHAVFYDENGRFLEKRSYEKGEIRYVEAFISREI